MGWNEDDLHRWLSTQPWPEGLAGSRGHDAAVLGPIDGHVVTCTDQCLEGVHFDAATPRDQAGAKAVLRTLSDLAATAAVPRAVTLALRAPAAWSEAEVRSAILGARGAAVDHGAELVAGDLAQGPGPASLTVAAIGCVEPARARVGRDRAVPGQDLVLTGPVGGSLASGRHLRIQPRFAEAGRLVRAGATGMMDVSDGLALDLSRLARASGVAILLDLDRVPVHPDAASAAAAQGAADQGSAGGASALQRALADGEDHELVATLPAGATGHGAALIGAVEAGEGLWLLEGGVRRRWVPAEGGWIHGGDHAR